MKTLIWIIIIILIIGGVYWFINRNKSESVINNTYNSSTNNQSTTTVNINTSTSTATTTATVSKKVTITYTSSGFSPKSVAIKKDDTVVFVNQSSSGLWVASAFHPTHSVYDGTTLKEHCAAGAVPSFDSCKNIAKGESYSFTFTKIGTWAYHNHSSTSYTGKIIVE